MYANLRQELAQRAGALGVTIYLINPNSQDQLQMAIEHADIIILFKNHRTEHKLLKYLTNITL